MPPFSSVHFISRNLPALTRMTWLARFGSGSVNRVSNCLRGTEEPFLVPSSRNPSLQARGLSPWVEGWCALLTVIARLSGVLCVVGVTQYSSKSFIKSSFSSVRPPDRVGRQLSSALFQARGPSVSVQFSSFCSVYELFRP